MRVGSKQRWGARRWAGLALAVAFGVSAAPAWADCPGVLPSCWAERIDRACERAPTSVCLGDLRLRLLEKVMGEASEEGRDLVRRQIFDMAIASPDLDQRRRIAGLAARAGGPDDGFSRAVRAFAEPRFDWRARLAADDFAGALAAMPAPDLAVSDRWLRPVLDVIFERALSVGRGGEVLDGLADGRPAWADWGGVRESVLRGWFDRVATRAPDLLDRLICLAEPSQARSLRLARAAIDADPSAIGRAVASEFPGEGAVDDDGERAIWDAFGLLETRPAEVRERFLDALPRSVSAEFTGSKGASLDGPVIRGERGVVERLVARTLPRDAATSVFLWDETVRSAPIARTVTALDAPDRTDARLLMAQALIAEGAVDEALAIADRPESRTRLFGADADTSRAEAIGRALLGRAPTKAGRAYFARLGRERFETVKSRWANAEAGKRLLAIVAADRATGTGETPLDGVDDAVFQAAWDEASLRHDCGAMMGVSRRRGQTILAEARDLDWVASCVERKETGR